MVYTTTVTYIDDLWGGCYTFLNQFYSEKPPPGHILDYLHRKIKHPHRRGDRERWNKSTFIRTTVTLCPLVVQHKRWKLSFMAIIYETTILENILIKLDKQISYGMGMDLNNLQGWLDKLAKSHTFSSEFSLNSFRCVLYGDYLFEYRGSLFKPPQYRMGLFSIHI